MVWQSPGTGIAYQRIPHIRQLSAMLPSPLSLLWTFSAQFRRVIDLSLTEWLRNGDSSDETLGYVNRERIKWPIVVHKNWDRGAKESTLGKIGRRLNLIFEIIGGWCDIASKNWDWNHRRISTMSCGIWQNFICYVCEIGIASFILSKRSDFVSFRPRYWWSWFVRQHVQDSSRGFGWFLCCELDDLQFNLDIFAFQKCVVTFHPRNIFASCMMTQSWNRKSLR
jgi:hypothetical protein